MEEIFDLAGYHGSEAVASAHSSQCRVPGEQCQPPYASQYLLGSGRRFSSGSSLHGSMPDSQTTLASSHLQPGATGATQGAKRSEEHKDGTKLHGIQIKHMEKAMTSLVRIAECVHLTTLRLPEVVG
jgi:hypothetical protein